MESSQSISHKSAVSHHQRCAVQITYTKNATPGVWKAHGRYIAGESATAEGKPNSAGFDSKGQRIDVAGRLPKWQAAKDELPPPINLRRRGSILQVSFSQDSHMVRHVPRDDEGQGAYAEAIVAGNASPRPCLVRHIAEK